MSVLLLNCLKGLVTKKYKIKSIIFIDFDLIIDKIRNFNFQKGFFVSIKVLIIVMILLWTTFMFFALPIVFILLLISTLISMPMFLVGMNMPGNKYNLTFSYDGKKIYSSKKIATTFIVFLVVLLYYFFITFIRLGETLNIT
jgi:hypothetical protein